MIHLRWALQCTHIYMQNAYDEAIMVIDLESVPAGCAARLELGLKLMTN